MPLSWLYRTNPVYKLAHSEQTESTALNKYPQFTTTALVAITPNNNINLLCEMQPIIH
jgi:hypothetical protein